jgi:hypothetical protein
MRNLTGHGGFGVGSQWFDGSQRGSRPTAGMGLAVVLRYFGCGSAGMGLRCVGVF